jgi:X-linked retinitis pigmentosa GTPase regulator
MDKFSCHSLGITFFLAHGEVYVWGSNSDGQLGLPDTNDNILSPVLLPFDQRIVHISCGYYHTAFVTGMFL